MKISISQNLVIVKGDSASDIVSKEVIECCNTIVVSMKKQFPVPMRKFKGIVFKRCSHAEFDIDNMQIIIPIFGKNKSLKEVDTDEDYATGSYVIQHGFAGTLWHEFGHMIDRYIVYSAKRKPSLQDEWFDCKKKLQQELGYVSDYGNKNTSEWVAERFCKEHMEPALKILITSMEEYVGRIGGHD